MKNFEHCDFCNKPIKEFWCLKNKINGNRLKACPNCIKHFPDIKDENGTPVKDLLN